MDEAEFDEFYTASLRRVTGQVYALIGDLDEAQDCVQEAFVRAWAHRRKLERADHPEAWVRVTAHRIAISRWRRTVRSRRSPDRALELRSQLPEIDPSHVALVEALRQLPEAQRHAIVLHHIADLPVHQVASEVGAPEGTVKARLSRGRAALATLLADDASTGPTTGPTTGLQGGASHV
ncbi:MAG: SigE family RNA polymerase sigma factor [Nocardioides sp.]